MKKSSRTFSIFTFIFLCVSFVLAPANLVFADDAATAKTTADSDKDADKKKKGDKKKDGKGKGKKGDGEEEPECE